jgi:hypothetical protein
LDFRAYSAEDTTAVWRKRQIRFQVTVAYRPAARAFCLFHTALTNGKEWMRPTWGKLKIGVYGRELKHHRPSNQKISSHNMAAMVTVASSRAIGSLQNKGCG